MSTFAQLEQHLPNKTLQIPNVCRTFGRMPTGSKFSRTKSVADRPLRTPPHVPIGALRAVADVTLEELAAGIGQIWEEEGRSDAKPPSRGTLSAIESGRRGASPELLAAIEKFFHLDPGTITTAYRPRPRARFAA
ncbi:HTH DNA binding protein [Mycobacterium phage Cornie]|uniref:Cro protein n=1 Tax=Mycobacterium phage Cornie TaxID=2704043 RepID=A0A6G6XKN3_9CAUD|nr:HTH DNA binding protein [Mycobacterium phage Cornie]QIG58415.1 Cro protein [Mycobacterium phage Cornie]